MMIKNLASSIIIYEKVRTTPAKAKLAASMAAKAISLARRGDLNSKRKIAQILPQPLAVKKTIVTLSKRYHDRQSGFTRITKIGSRQGDGANLVQIELI